VTSGFSWSSFTSAEPLIFDWPPTQFGDGLAELSRAWHPAGLFLADELLLLLQNFRRIH
jgi:hypothetical protein